MDNSLIKDYPEIELIKIDELDDNTSVKKMFTMVGSNKKVVDFGCGTGYFSWVLKSQGCTVTGVEINSHAARIAEKYCQEVIVADLDFVSVKDILPLQEFDVAICGDILEHLRNPWQVLRDVKQILKKDGYIVASIPNIAHGAIRLALLQGKFDYMELGILDNTHLRFFTRESVENLFEDSGYFINCVERTQLPIFTDIPWVPRVSKSNFDENIIKSVENSPESDTLQFIIKANPDTMEGKYERLSQRYSSLSQEVERSQSQLQQTQTEFERSQSQLQRTQAEFERSQSQLQQTQAEFERSQSQLQQTQTEFERSQSQLQQTQAEFERSQSQLQQTKNDYEILQHHQEETHRQLELSNETIAAMKTSKFWKLRVLWFKFKAIVKPVVFAFRNQVTSNKLLSNFRNSSSTVTEIDIAGTDITINSVTSENPLVKHSATVDIIICVHNAFEDVKICLESVIRYSRVPYSLILIDDGSQEETHKYLLDFANSQAATLIRNETARGYTFAANQGLRLSKASYAILLNSDTIVTPDWLDRIVACGESDPRIGIVGPLSNTASWQSIPEISHQGDWAENKLPEDMSVADMGRLVAEYSHRLYPRIPFLNGFCLAIKRSTIEDIGYFDEDAFGAGYGEENDYCLRADQAGWQLAIADDAYVYHSQSRSYSNERRKLLCEQADKALVAKHGQQIISDSVSICRFDRVLEGIRIRSKVMFMRQQLIDAGKRLWEGKRILIILPITEPGGGGNVIFQEAAAMQKMGVDVRILNFNSYQASFEKSYPDTTITVIYVENESEIPELLSQYDAVIATLYKSVYWLESTEDAKSRDTSVNSPVCGYYIQDFEPDFFPLDTEEYNIALESYTHNPNLVRVTKTAWNRDIVKQKSGIEPLLIGPSVNLDLYSPRRRQGANLSEKHLRIAAMIRPSSPRRNAELTMKILQQIYQLHGDKIEIVIFGCSSDELQSLEFKYKFPWLNAGILTRPQLAFLLNEIDIFADFSIFQAMGLTAMEAMASSVAVIVPQNGGASSFAIDEHNSLIVDTNSQEACLNQLNRLILDEQLRLRLQKQALEDICQYFPEKVAYNTLKFLFNEND